MDAGLRMWGVSNGRIRLHQGKSQLVGGPFLFFFFRKALLKTRDLFDVLAGWLRGHVGRDVFNRCVEGKFLISGQSGVDNAMA